MSATESRGAHDVLEFALKYAASGLRIFPLHHATAGKCSCGNPKCESVAKHPRTPRGSHDAACDAQTIEKWWAQWPSANIGLSLQGLVAIDIDPRHNGDLTFDALTQKYGPLPDTWTARTGGGGLHHVFTADNKAKYRGALGAGVDLKHGHGYIVVEPSVHASGQRYLWLDESGPTDGGAIANAPEWLSTHTAEGEGARIFHGPNAGNIGGGGRNNFLYERARRLRDLSLREGEVYAALRGINQARCVPPLDDHEIATIARSASQNDPVEGSLAGKFITLAPFVSDITPPVWLVDGLIQRSYVYGITALTNHGKTAVATTMALSVATATKFGNADTERGRVLYLCGENPEDFKVRLRGCLQFMGIKVEHADEYFTILPQTQALNTMFDDITAAANAAGGFALVIVDTSVAYFSYDEENDNVDAGAHARDLRKLVDQLGNPAVVALCHPVKNATRDNLLPRGGGAFLNELDCNLTLWKDGDTAELSHNKLRGPSFQPMQFELLKLAVTGVLDSKGRTMSTVVAKHLSDQHAQALLDGLEDDERAIMQAVAHGQVSISDIARNCQWILANGEPNKNRVHRRLAGLKENQMVRQTTSKRYVATKKGKAEFSL